MSIPNVFAALVDDAAIFPPGSLPLPEAVIAHAAHRNSRVQALVGPFVLGAGALAAAAQLATPELFPEPLPVSVVVPTPDAVAETIEAADGLRVAVRALEVKLDRSQPLTPQVTAIANHDRRGITTYVEVPRPSHPEWPEVLAAVAANGLRLKFRTGGTQADAFPDDTELATWIGDAARSSTPFKCTAGLHNALRHTDATTGFEHHGFLNVLCAASAALDNAGNNSLATILAERDAAVLTETLGDTARTTPRTLFISYGSCSIDEPYEDLAALGLLDR
ncbi:hypothetical protein K7711_00140 [Nocardia sp. CA2R105]|uniref:hypothetical protein n=1 Tax=Nocardia coffeae TaxID=2873381 RepID=UPI001CA65016|nr:hypothetical protein [Nocardia coffeae]MBY8854879.1 hypothetical protein [Nocardia coffeae]